MSFITDHHKFPMSSIQNLKRTHEDADLALLIIKKYPESGENIYINHGVTFVCLKCIIEKIIPEMLVFTPSIFSIDSNNSNEKQLEKYELPECKIHGKTRYGEL